MSTAAKLTPTRTTPFGPLLDVPAGIWVLLLFALCYAPGFQDLFHQWHSNEDMGHGFFVPLIAGYIVWERRAALQSCLAEADRSFSGWGLALILWGAIQWILGAFAAEIFLQRSALMFSLCGILLYLGGAKLIRLLAFPILLLLFMIPIPGIILKSVTFPLQLLSSRIAEAALEMLGYSVVRDGNILELAGQLLSVVEACSGLRALLSLSFFSLCYAYLVDPRPSTRWIMFAATIPIALLANAGRIVVTAILGRYDEELARGFFHSFSGWVIFVISIAMLAGLHKAIVYFRKAES